MGGPVSRGSVRPAVPRSAARWQDADGSDLWAGRDGSREPILDFHQRATAHADATVTALSLDAAGRVPWWPRPEVTLFGVLVHVLTDTTRHAGHADILREHLDGRTGVAARYEEPIDPAARAAHRATIEEAAAEDR